MFVRQIVVVLVLSSVLLAQSSSPGGAQKQGPQSAASPQTPAAQQAPADSNDSLAQMRADLNRLESLNLNMSSEIEFLRDQNLQILLRTNSQMWTVLINDLRRQIEREEQTRTPAKGHDGAVTPQSR